MATMNKLMDRLVCTKSLFENLKSLPDAYQKHVELQLNSISEMIKGAAFTPDNVATLLGAVAHSGFPADAQVRIMNLVINGAGEPTSASGKRVKLQNYVNLHHYIVADVWAQLNEFSFDGSVALLVEYLVHGLMLRHPTEPTFRTIAAVICLKQLGKNATLAMPPHEKGNVVQAVKYALRRLIKVAPAPSVYILDLPASPSILLKSHPNFFGTTMPIACEYDDIAMKWIADSFPLRAPKQMTCHPMSSGGGGAQPSLESSVQQALLQILQGSGKHLNGQIHTNC